MNNRIIEHKTEASGASPTIPLEKMEIVYPRWISHLVKDRVMVNSAEEAAPFYADGYTPWPIVIQPTDAEIVKVKVQDLEKQIEVLLNSLGDDDKKRIVREIYGDAEKIEEVGVEQKSDLPDEGNATESALVQVPAKKKGRPKKEKQ